jgi:hypothetical protein
MKPARKFNPALRAVTFKHKAEKRNHTRQQAKNNLRKSNEQN